MIPSHLGPQASSELLSQLWRRHQVCFLHYIRGVKKTESKKPHRVLFPFCLVLWIPQFFQLLTTFDSLGFFQTRACKLSSCCACKCDLLCSVQFNPCDPGSVFSLFQEHEWSIWEWTGTLSTVLVLVPRSASMERVPVVEKIRQSPWCGESWYLLASNYCFSPEVFRTATLRLVMELKKTTSRVYNAALLLPLFLLFWGKFLSSVPDSYPATMQ